MNAEQQVTPEVRKKVTQFGFPAVTMIQQLANKDCTPEGKVAAQLLVDLIENAISGVLPTAAEPKKKAA